MQNEIKFYAKFIFFSVVASVDNFRLHWHTLGWCNVRSAVNRVWYKNTKLLLLWNWMYTEENVTCMVMVHSHLKWYECPNKWAYLHTMVLAQFHLGFAFLFYLVMQDGIFKDIIFLCYWIRKAEAYGAIQCPIKMIMSNDVQIGYTINYKKSRFFLNALTTITKMLIQKLVT